MTPLYVGGQNCEPIAVQSFQYQAKAEPVFIPTAAPETITSDKWGVGSSQPRFDLERQQFTYQSFFGEGLHVVPVPPSTTPVYVSTQACEPISITHFQYPSLTKPVFTPATVPETITMDKWLGYWPQPYFRPKRLIQYGVNIAVAEQADDGLPPVHWMPPSNRQIRFIKPNVATGLFELRQTAFGEAVSLDKWAQRLQEPRRDLLRWQYVYQAVVSDYLSQVPGAEVIRLDKWGKNSPDQVFRSRRLVDYGSFAIDPTLRVERPSLDKWSQPQAEPRHDLRRQQHTFPINVSDYLAQVPGAEVIKLDKWFVRPYERFGQRRLPPLELTVQPIATAEVATGLGWYQPQVVPVRTLRRLRELFPHLSIDAAFFLVPSYTDFLAYDRDVGIIALRMEDGGPLVLLTNDLSTVGLQTNNAGTIAILTEDFGVLD